MSNRGSDGAKQPVRVTRWRVFAAILVVLTAVTAFVVLTQEQPDEPPSYLNDSQSEFYEHCKSNGGTVLVKLDGKPVSDMRCEYENGTKEHYTTHEW